jgi:hypothetical protein
MTGFAQSSSGSGEEGKKNKQGLEKGKGRDMGEKDEADKDNKDPSDDPDDPSGDLDGIFAGPAEISFQIASEIHPIQDEQNTFQTLTMHGSLTIEVLHYCYCIVVLPNQIPPVDDTTCSESTPIFRMFCSIHRAYTWHSATNI